MRLSPRASLALPASQPAQKRLRDSALAGGLTLLAAVRLSVKGRVLLLGPSFGGGGGRK